nr:MAG TPA: C2H2 type zinc-finger protein [Caudoviricetes sp.]
MAECIERKAALDAVHKWCDPCGAAVEAVLSVPAADAAPVVHGRWVLHYTAIGAPYTECSRCCTDIAAPMVGGGLLKLDMREMPYCPICGAQMDGGEAT